MRATSPTQLLDHLPFSCPAALCSGRFFLSAGADGSLFVYETKGALHLTREQAARQHPALHVSGWLRKARKHV
jgi:hypothetical protein